MRIVIHMTTLNDFIDKKPVKSIKYDENGIRTETEEEVENWKKI